jgi:branched-chain amino acid transport system ATP-binding protein
MRRCARSTWERSAVAEPLLALRDVRAGYGDAVILDGISFEIPERGSLAVLGRNGVGKSTLLLTIMGFTRLHSGSILWKGRDITSLAPHERARLGLGWVAQERDIFPSLTVEENLTVAARAGPWGLGAVYGLFPRLQERRASMGNQLSGGEQQMLAIARALVTNPALLLLDEPLEGLAPIIVAALATSLEKMMREGMAAILVEQHTEVALSLTDEALVIERGTIAHRARSGDFARDAATLERYVGLAAAAPT